MTGPIMNLRSTPNVPQRSMPTPLAAALTGAFGSTNRLTVVSRPASSGSGRGPLGWRRCAS